MEQINAVVDCDVARLNIPLRPWFAKVGFGFVALFRRVPADVTQVAVSVFSGDGVAPTVIAAKEHADGSWFVRCPASAFLAAGEFRYTVFCVANDGAPSALGEGRLKVLAN